ARRPGRRGACTHRAGADQARRSFLPGGRATGPTGQCTGARSDYRIAMTTRALWCVVPAAGRGMRVGGDRPKQYQLLAGRPLIEHTLARLAAHPQVAGLLVTLGAGDPHWSGVETLQGKPVRTAIGGVERSDSVLAGLDALPAVVGADDFVLVHDAARPCVRLADIGKLIELAAATDGGLLAARLGMKVSDEAMAMEQAGFAPLLVEGAEDNIKVTTAADFALAEFLLERTA